MEIILQILSAGSALLAAVLWLRSAKIKTPKEFRVQVFVSVFNDPGMPSYEVNAVGYGTSEELERLGNAMIEQSRLSAQAAQCAAASALLQVVAIVLPLISN